MQYRVKIVTDISGKSVYIPQYRWCYIWFSFNVYVFGGGPITLEESSLEDALNTINKSSIINSKKIISYVHPKLVESKSSLENCSNPHEKTLLLLEDLKVAAEKWATRLELTDKIEHATKLANDLEVELPQVSQIIYGLIEEIKKSSKDQEKI